MGNRSYGGRGIVLDVTPEIVNVAIQRDSGHCVVADALKAAVPMARNVSVDLQTIRWTDLASRRRYIYLTPGPLQALLVNFDQGVKPDPAMFRLGRPAQIVKLPDRSAIPSADTKNTGTGTTGKAKRPRVSKHREVKEDGRSGHIQVRGGDYPPTAALSSTRGRRRAFGIRGLKP